VVEQITAAWATLVIGLFLVVQGVENVGLAEAVRHAFAVAATHIKLI
jgi:Na+/H+ antiporter NhaD/arsenite permease-like protein